MNLRQEQIIVEEKKSKTQAIIETIGQEKAVVDSAVEAGREDEEAASKLAVSHMVQHICIPVICITQPQTDPATPLVSLTALLLDLPIFPRN